MQSRVNIDLECSSLTFLHQWPPLPLEMRQISVWQDLWPLSVFFLGFENTQKLPDLLSVPFICSGVERYTLLLPWKQTHILKKQIQCLPSNNNI